MIGYRDPESVMLRIDSTKTVSVENFLDFRLDTIGKQSIIKLSSY